MPKDYPRADRVATLIHSELGRAFPLEVYEPWVKMLTITAVEVSRDFKVAKIFLSIYSEDKSEIEAIIKQLNNDYAKPLRQYLAKNINMRTTPELRFAFDPSVSGGRRMSDLLSKL